MKYRTFTVLFVEEYDEGNGVEMTDPEAIAEVKGTLQDCYDNYHAPGTNFLIVGVEDGADEFWASWADKMREDHGAKESS